LTVLRPADPSPFWSNGAKVASSLLYGFPRRSKLDGVGELPALSSPVIVWLLEVAAICYHYELPASEPGQSIDSLA